MHSRTLVGMLVLALAAACGDKSAGGPLETDAPAVDDTTGSCIANSDCPLGWSCVAGLCQENKSEADAGPLCERDEDCPGQRCDVYTGQCVAAHQDAGPDTEERDAGPLPDCADGMVRTCGSSKVGECRFGTEACVDGHWSGVCDGAIEPQPAELCNGKDDDCDGLVPAGELDADTDGVRVCGGDCDDHDPARHTGATELCNGVDDDCDGTSERDLDGDRFLSCQGDVPGVLDGDCNDYDKTIYPGAPELCDGKDNRCAGAIPAAELDNDRDTYMACAGCAASLKCGDCDDKDSGVNPGAAEVCNGKDDNCDGVGLLASGTAVEFTSAGPVDQDRDGYLACADCNDARSDINPAAVELVCDEVDNDCRNGDLCNCWDDDADGSWAVACGGDDCDDSRSDVHPGAAEVCDGVDNDCDGAWERDTDNDTYYACAAVTPAIRGGDCDNLDPAVHPDAAERCNGADDDCNGAIPASEADGDGDGERICQGDCDDQDIARHHGASERCNGLDDDCDGALPQNERDADSDGVKGCGGDCNDGDPTVYPFAPELCDGKDNDCAGGLPLGERDQDTDTYMACTGCGAGSRCGDCNDTVKAVNPGALEVCNGVDDNCDGVKLSGEVDSDKDGIFLCTGDCDDSRSDVYPGAVEKCDGVDNNCDGVGLRAAGVDIEIVANGSGGFTRVDADFDGYMMCADCPGSDRDYDGTINPGASEKCNGKDDDCDGLIDENYDYDRDTYTSCGTLPSGEGLDPTRVDCAPTNANIHPGANDVCGNSVDEDCNGYDAKCCNPAVDADTDGANECDDCNDLDRFMKPGLAEVCDGKDNDCNKNSVENCFVGQGCNWDGDWYESNDADVCAPDLICVQNGVTGEYTCASFCNTSELGAGLGDGCAAAEACTSMLTNSANLHLCGVVPNPGTLESGQSCDPQTPEMCKSNTCSQDNVCSDYCGSNAYCGGGTSCKVTVASVYMGEGQPSGQALTGVCSITSSGKDRGASCGADAECKSGWCSGGKCTVPCCTSADCAAGEHCGMDGRYHTDPTYGELTGVPVCIPDAAANGKRPAGAACTSNVDCKSEFCERTYLGGKCVETCCHDFTCPDQMTCELVNASEKLTSGGSAVNGHWERVCAHNPPPSRVLRQP